MPAWLQFVLGLSSLLLALGVIGQRLLKPLWRTARKIEDAVPLMVDLTTQLQDTAAPGSVLKDIIAEFRSDSGSTAKDSLNRLESAVSLLTGNAEAIRIATEAARQLAERDREQMARLIREQDRTSVKLDGAIAALIAVINDRADVATDLAARRQRDDAAVAGVAEDLAASHERAAAADGTKLGAAADAAATLIPTPQEASDDAATAKWLGDADRRAEDKGRPDGQPDRRSP